MSLAIVIPAYKPNFIRETLKSLSLQTDKRFNLYIGDDASPYDLKSIVDEFNSELNLIYKRFENNLGGISLVKHWERCIALTSENWIWLFSDDDVMDPSCVEHFYKELKSNKNPYDIYRFNNRVINAEGIEKKINEAQDQYESLEVADFLKKKFCFDLNSFACEYIFSRLKFIETGGFVDFPVGWCSDDSMWCMLAKDKGIYTIQGPKVYWRLSGENISSVGNIFEENKIDAILKFYKWLKLKISPGIFTSEEIRRNSKKFLFVNVSNFGIKLNFTQILRIASQTKQIYAQTLVESIIEIMIVNFKIKGKS